MRTKFSGSWGMAVVVAAMLAGADAYGQTGVPDGDVPCGPVVFRFTDEATCTRLGLGEAPCERRCGRLCWRPQRGIWVWLQDKKGCPGGLPMPTPTPSPTPRRPWRFGR